MGLFPEIIITPDNLRGARKTPNVSFYELFTVSDLSRYSYIRFSHVAFEGSRRVNLDLEAAEGGL